MGSADRSPSARPCRPATAFDFRQPRARARARATEGKCWRFIADDIGGAGIVVDRHIADQRRVGIAEGLEIVVEPVVGTAPRRPEPTLL